MSLPSHSQVACPAPGRPAGRVLLSFEADSRVGVMVTSSQPGWASAAVARYTTGGARSVAHGVLRGSDALCHVEVLDNGNFTRSVDLVSLGDYGLVEFVQLHAQHEPQLIIYRELKRSSNPWAAAK